MFGGLIKCECGIEMFIESINDSTNCIQCNTQINLEELPKTLELIDEELEE